MQFETVGDQDLSRERVLILTDGTKVTFKASDPYGFWTIHYERGEVPRHLRGNYTDFAHAKEAYEAYMRAYNHKNYHEKQTELFADTRPTKENIKQEMPEKPVIRMKSAKQPKS